MKRLLGILVIALGLVVVIGALLVAASMYSNRRLPAEGELAAAAERGEAAAVKGLVARSGDANARDNGYTPLMFAAMDDDPELVKLLLEPGADPHAEHDGSNALTHAVGAAALGKLADIDRAAANPCPVETVRLLLAKAPDLRVRTSVLDRATSAILKTKCPAIARLLDDPRAAARPAQAAARN